MATVSDFMQLLAENVWLYGGAFLLVLSVLVFVHEWGHYIVAKMCGVKVTSFSIGFGPELFGYTDKSGTRWKFSLIPLGGYVQMFGDQDPASAAHSEDVKEGEEAPRPMTDEEKKQAFFAKSVGQRSAIVFAGPAINFIFAVILLAGLYSFYGKPVTPPVAGAVVQGTAADQAGFKPHDVILSIDGNVVQSFEHIRRAVMIGLDTPLQFVVERNGEQVEFTATPEKIEERDRFGFSQSRGLLGILGPAEGLHLSAVVSVDGQGVEDIDAAREAIIQKLGQEVVLGLRSTEEEISYYIARPMKEMNEALLDEESADYNHVIIMNELTDNYMLTYGFVDSMREAVIETADITVSTLYALGQMITGTRSAKELGGIIRIGAIAGDMATSGMIALITFTALLSINLGLINLFPIPLLDGGHLVFYGIEAVKGSPVSENMQEYAFRFGVVVLVGLMLFANLNDIFHLLL